MFSTDSGLARCSLTFLAVQAPGISKYCGICGKQYLNDQYVLEQDHVLNTVYPAGNGEGGLLLAPSTNAPELEGTHEEQGNESRVSQTPLTLAQLLVGACDLCIYCGGKFVG